MRNTKRRTVLILAAGLGTRLKELTSDRPKALVELNGKPLLEIVIENLISQNFNHFVINVHHFGDKIIDFIANKHYEHVEIEISDERDFLYYTGGAILKALPFFDKSEAVLIHNVDIYSNVDFQQYYDDFVRSDDAAWLLTQNRNNNSKVVFDEQDNFRGTYNLQTNVYDGCEELKECYQLLSFSGLHFVKPKYFSDFELKRCHVWSLYKDIAKVNNVKSVLIQPDYWFDLGTQEQLKEVSEWIR